MMKRCEQFTIAARQCSEQSASCSTAAMQCSDGADAVTERRATSGQNQQSARAG